MPQPMDGKLYCFSCRQRKLADCFTGDNERVCENCRDADKAIRHQLQIAKAGKQDLRSAIAAILEQGKKPSNLCTVSEVATGLVTEFGGVSELCRFAKALLTEDKTNPKVKLDILKWVTSMIALAHEMEGKAEEFDEMSEDDMFHLLSSLLVEKGLKLVPVEDAA